MAGWLSMLMASSWQAHASMLNGELMHRCLMAGSCIEAHGEFEYRCLSQSMIMFVLNANVDAKVYITEAKPWCKHTMFFVHSVALKSLVSQDSLYVSHDLILSCPTCRVCIWSLLPSISVRLYAELIGPLFVLSSRQTSALVLLHC